MLDWTVAEGRAAEAWLGRATADVWSADPRRSPFAGPAFLRQRAADTVAAGGRVLAALGTTPEGGARALWPLAVDPSGRIRFLQEGHADHATCLAGADVAPTDLAEGLARVLRAGHAGRLHLADVPPAGPTLEAVREATRRAGWSVRAFPAASCPVLRTAESPDGREALRRSVRGIKNLENRLKRLPGFAFEALEDGEGVAPWAREFCDAHERRWNATETPSMYRAATARRTFLAKLQAWAEDRVLIRFALRAEGERIAFVAGLRAPDRLVYHHVCHAPGHESASPGMVLLRRIILWMADHGHPTIDFGQGSEPYKLRFATDDEKVWRILGAARAISASVARAFVEEQIRASPGLQAIWERWANRRVRTQLRHRAERLRGRLATVAKVHARSPLRVLWGRARARLGSERMLYYVAARSDEPRDAGVLELEVLDVLDMLEAEITLQADERAELLGRPRAGTRPFGVIEGGAVAQVCWLRAARADEVPPGIPADRAWVIADCVTARRARGRGLYPRVLRALLTVVPEGAQVLIYTHDWNRASQRGILKAGFAPLAVRESSRAPGGRELRWGPVDPAVVPEA